MEEKIAYNAVAIACQNSYKKMATLIAKHGTWNEAYDYMARRNRVDREEAARQWDSLQQLGIKLLLKEDPAYPPLLTEITDPPFGIYIRGDAEVLTSHALALVGTRRATVSGKETAKRFGRAVAEAGFTIVSGLALGIDAAGHVGCLDAAGTRTIAVLAGGLDGIYPKENERLGEKILATGGALVAEYPPGAPTYPIRFLERNRIISGLSVGTIVIEAPKNSGSLATARYALEQNRDVFVTPGPIDHPNFFGSHELIRQGAQLVTTPDHILESYGITKEMQRSRATLAASPEEKQILTVLKEISGPADVDKIADAAKLEPRIVSQALTFLLIKDLIKEKEGGYTI